VNTAHRLESRLLREAGFSHAFFTRRGGTSRGPYASLNFSWTVGDDERNVIENVSRAARQLGVDASRLYWLSQVHGSDAHVVTDSEDPTAVRERSGDALLGAAAGVACGVRTADCVPVLLADERSGCVAAAHAGWRGVVLGVVPATVEHLRALAGRGAEIVAAIGPHISAGAFEVGEDVADELARSSPVAGVVRRGSAERPHVDLRAIVRAQLRAAGVDDARVDDVFGCTVSDPELFFSYRRDGPRSGRHLSAIVAR
jgi:hypothetical protein